MERKHLFFTYHKKYTQRKMDQNSHILFSVVREKYKIGVYVPFSIVSATI